MTDKLNKHWGFIEKALDDLRALIEMNEKVGVK